MIDTFVCTLHRFPDDLKNVASRAKEFASGVDEMNRSERAAILQENASTIRDELIRCDGLRFRRHTFRSGSLFAVPRLYHPVCVHACQNTPADPFPRIARLISIHEFCRIVDSGSSYGTLSAQLASGAAAGEPDRQTIDATFKRIFALIDSFEAVLEESFGLR